MGIGDKGANSEGGAITNPEPAEKDLGKEEKKGGGWGRDHLWSEQSLPPDSSRSLFSLFRRRPRE